VEDQVGALETPADNSAALVIKADTAMRLGLGRRDFRKNRHNPPQAA
jgi:hypothetical protein